MTRERARRIRAISTDLADILSQLIDLRDEERKAFYSRPHGFQTGPRGIVSEAAVEFLASAATHVSLAHGHIDNIILPDEKEEA